MASQFNNPAENPEQVFSEDQFRTVFFDSSKRASTSQDPSHKKRARLDPTLSSISRKSSVSSASTTSTNSQTSHPMSPSTSTSSNMSMTPQDEDDDDVVRTTSNVKKLTVDAVQSALQDNSLKLFDHGIHPGFVSTPTGCNTPSNLEDEEMVSATIPNPPSVNTPISFQQQPTSSSSNSTTTNMMNSKLQRKRTTKTQTKIRKYRSRSLPNIVFISKNSETLQTKTKNEHQLINALNSSNTHVSHPSSSSSSATATVSTSTSSVSSKFSYPPPLPPVNIQSLKEIDLAEIIKNPQLRHDILFDPQLQFRPNLDGERGRRKKITYDKYWNGVKEEIQQYSTNKLQFNEKTSRLPSLFITLREILISLLPSKDKNSVMDVLDIELTMQQLVKNSLDFVALSKWLSEIFKSHCAPMRDPWVDEMIMKFVEADETKSVSTLVEGLRMVFTILEAMKLDIANHQIRILRPVLIETAVEFERDYFLQMISRCKLDITDSINWFKKHNEESKLKKPDITPRETSVVSILSLLSCSHMVSEFPSSLAFDHSRLIVLRANIRQLVCLNLCLALYRQLVCKHSPANRTELLSKKAMSSLKKEILAIITDAHGNVKWTRNIGSIALQIVRRAVPNDAIPKDTIVEFGFNWLIKQTQPSSQVYALMEQQVFNSISAKIEEVETKNSNLNGGNPDSIIFSKLIPMASGNNNVIPSSSSNGSSNNLNSTSTSQVTSKSDNDEEESENDLSAISSRIALVCKFHWQVFGSYYSESLEQ